ncbi:MAG: D-alanine--D-alanine ligase family protein [Acidimicrobiales bacterium]
MPEVAVIFGGPSPEHDVSVLTGLQAARALAERADRPAPSVRCLFWSKTGDWYETDPGLEAESFVEGVPRGAVRLQFIAAPDGGFAEQGRRGRGKPLGFDAALVCCHGGPGEDGTLQAALDLAAVPHAGPTVAGAAIGMDKLAFGSLVTTAGLPALPRILLRPGGDPPPFDGPYIVKPRFGGSSIGIEVVEDFPTARARLGVNRHLRSGAVLEPYRPDLSDLQVAVRTWPQLELSAVERPIRATAASDILGYRDKYVAGEGMAGAPRELPADIPSELEKEIRQASERIAELSGVRGVARIDFLSDGGEVLVNEINTVPGSLARYLWVSPPLAFTALLDDLLTEARERPTHSYSAEGADGTVLRSAGSIAGKLG